MESLCRAYTRGVHTSRAVAAAVKCNTGGADR